MESALSAIPFESVIQIHGCGWWCSNIASALSALDLRPMVKVRMGVSGICAVCSPIWKGHSSSWWRVVMWNIDPALSAFDLHAYCQSDGWGEGYLRYLQSRLKGLMKFMILRYLHLIYMHRVKVRVGMSGICAIYSPVWKGHQSLWLRIVVCEHWICAICIWFEGI